MTNRQELSEDCLCTTTNVLQEKQKTGKLIFQKCDSVGITILIFWYFFNLFFLY